MHNSALSQNISKRVERQYYLIESASTGEVQHHATLVHCGYWTLTTIVSAVVELLSNVAITQFRQLQNVTVSSSVCRQRTM
ncbi:hypothetical protein FD14_GL001228 [Secundilactobacillus similis DSM 23365 = JCM 2765]|uniref:Uncharacterized protein n=1 Tax=Secundilactobacillus similis DSM 23365 = JCM 2765 TaxID=1423804 RepID=A0A0R2EXS0_9LACO|nr:hypothetical protein FD14_GL001228 [Secundilactobacillus similis DSM 23365 = JCM 2765]